MLEYWLLHGDLYRNQIYYFLVQQRWKLCKNVVSRPGPECGSDHNLLVTYMKCMLKICVKPKIRQRRLETSDEIFGHVIRGPEGIEKLMVMGITKGKRTAGRVLTRWTDIFRKRTGLLFVESVRQSEDRS